MTWAKVPVFQLMSRLVLACLVIAIPLVAHAHEVRPAISNLTIADGAVTIDIEMALEAPLAGIDLDGLSNTNDAENAELYDTLRALGPAALEAELRAAWPALQRSITLMAGETPVEPQLDGVTVPEVGFVESARPSVLRLSGALPDDGTPVVFGWDAALGPLVVRQQGVEAGYTGYLTGGRLSDPIPRGEAGHSAAEMAWTYLVAGFDHIIPKGLDHILFVLGLFFFALHWAPLLWQVTAFTLAHSVTLGLATLGVIAIPADWMWLVEALIALSITYVAVENVLRPAMGWLRPAVVFAFGLLHGLGFASVLGEFGLPQGQFVLALLAFNLGVEAGQLAVILAAFVVIVLARALAEIARLGDEEALVRDLPVIYRAVSIVGSLVIAAVGAYWFVERIGLLP
ncbi:MAG: HupE/UreJ family protein [Pseudomonadota bacterium]